MNMSGAKLSLGLHKLQKVVADAFGLTARGIKNNADAKAYAAKVKAENENAIALIKARGKYELAEFIENKEQLKFANVQSVCGCAEKELKSEESVSEKELDQDWVNRFFSIIEGISKPQVQELWGKILAGEIKNPGAFSFRTLETLKNISQEEALVFQRLSPLIFLPSRDAFFNKDISIADKICLSDAGLIHPEELVKILTFPENQQKTHFCISRTRALTFYTNKTTPQKIKIPFYQLTRSGKELATLLPSVEDEEYIDALCEIAQKAGVSKVTKSSIIKWEEDRFSWDPNTEVLVASFV